MKILIVATFFPPQNSIGSQRPYSWAKYWSRWGHDVTVLTTEKVDHTSDSPMSYDGFRVICCPIPFMKIARCVVGGQVAEESALMDGAPSLKPCWLSLKALVRKRIISWQMRYGIFASCRMPDIHDLWSLTARRVASLERWDAVVTTGGPYPVHKVGMALLNSGQACQWILDWRDLWVDNEIYKGVAGFRCYEEFLERGFHAAADVITTVSSPWAEHLRKKAGDKVYVIYNGYDPEDYLSLPREQLLPDDGVFRIVYTGSIYPGRQDPSPLFKAIHSLAKRGCITPDRLQVLFAGANCDLSEVAWRNGVKEYVSWVGFVCRQDALRFQRDADALLILDAPPVGVNGWLLAKTFEYLVAGPPIMVVGPNVSSATAQIVEETQRGFIFATDVNAIQDWLLKQLAKPKAKKEEVFSIPESIAVYSREESARMLLRVLAECEEGGL